MINLREKLYKQYYEKQKDNLNIMLLQVIKDASSIDIPISSNIDKIVYVDYGMEFDCRAGFCEWTVKGNYKIHLTDKMLTMQDKYIKDVLAHEVIHTCPLCKNHYFIWLKYASMMNNIYGYNIVEKINGWESMEGE